MVERIARIQTSVIFRQSGECPVVIGNLSEKKSIQNLALSRLSWLQRGSVNLNVTNDITWQLEEVIRLLISVATF